MYLRELDHDKVFDLGQVGGVGGVFDGTLVVDLGDELGLLDVAVEVQWVVPVLHKQRFFMYNAFVTPNPHKKAKQIDSYGKAKIVPLHLHILC
jgi:hypothetical protein